MTDDHDRDRDADGGETEHDPDDGSESESESESAGAGAGPDVPDVDPNLSSTGGEREAAPMSDLAAEVSEEDLAGTDDDLFEQKQKPEVDREELWRQVTDEETAQRVVEKTDVDDAQTRRSDSDETDDVVRVVEKSAYCHACPFVSEPPDIHCTHEGTEILEAVDMQHFRVRNCPIAEENEELEEI